MLLLWNVEHRRKPLLGCDSLLAFTAILLFVYNKIVLKPGSLYHFKEVFLFMQKNNYSNIFSLASTSLLVAISIVLGRLTIYIPLFGFPSVRFSVTNIPIFLAGALFGGVYGAIAGLLSDIINFIIAPNGAYHPGFTMNAILVGLIPGIFFSRFKNGKSKRSYFIVNSVFSVLALIGAIIYINFIGIKELGDTGQKLGLEIPHLVTIIMIAILAILSAFNYVLQKKFADKDNIYAIDKIIFVNIINFIVVQLVLTPIWLMQLYNIPIIASISVRLFKCMIDIPLQVSMIYIVLKAIPYKIKRKYICKV